MNDTNPSLLPSSLFNQKPLSLDKELWLFAEERAQEILCVIQPNALSEANRKEIINYVKRLIRGYYGAEVFAFGSVPLKTYLPDGDIDFTVLSHENAEEDLAQKVRSILESEEKSGHQVKDVQHIRAQVQVVKCTVKDIAVDISFNQMAGLYALRFLEQVDQLLGRNHLFKRSIILIKAWLYYESRILGSHHGLLSTYAVEILVLYIINHFHSSVDGPLEVLYRFLDYYGKFDWETNYITVDGPKALSTLPEIVETPDCDRVGFLLSKEFLRSYKDICFVQSTVPGTKTHEFPTKFMNILDPLKSNNNLGRSVSKSSLHRIKMALSYGARKLKETLILPGECMGAAIENFFKITLDRNGKGLRPDVDVPVATFGTGRSEESDLRGDCESYDGGLPYVHKYHDHAMPLTAQASVLSSPSLADMHTISTYYCPMGNNIYVPEQTHYRLNAPQETHSIEETVPAETLYHSTATQTTYCLEKNVKSRGTCPYIPDMTHNSYWDMRARVTKPRRSNPGNHNVLPKLSRCKQPVQVEIHYETDTNDKSRRSLELTNVDFHGLPTIHKSSPSESMNGTSRSKGEFPLLPTFRQTSASESQEVLKLTKSGRNSPSSELNFELSNKVFPTISKTRPSETQGYVDLSDQARSTSLPQVKIELTDEEFPLLPSICKTRPSESKGSVKLTGEAKNFAPSCLQSELLNEEFPPLPRTHITHASEGQESVELTEHARNISSCQLNNACSKQESPLFPSILKAKSEGETSVCSCEQARNSSSSQLNIDFGTYSKSKSLTEPKKDEKEDSAVSSYGGSDTMLVVPKVAMKCTESDENKSWIDSI